jgi:hypothetical protein
MTAPAQARSPRPEPASTSSGDNALLADLLDVSPPREREVGG